MSDYEFAVITAVANPAQPPEQQPVPGWYPSGNLANVPELYIEPDDPSHKGPLEPFNDPHHLLAYPVFEVGEVLILNTAYGREIVGLGRNPSKWCVEYDVFDNIDDAIQRAQEVRA